jgi:Zn-dependent protease with chaperone function
MTSIATRLLLLVAFAGPTGGPPPAGSESVSEFTIRVTAELRAKNPEAADLFTQANEARDREELAEAERLYREVLDREPAFFHATRRLSGVVLAQGRRDEALALAREALAAEATPENQSAVIAALLGLGTGEATQHTAEERREALKHATALLKLPELDPTLALTACAAAMANKDLGLLRRCVGRLQEAAPDEASTHYFAWFVAMQEGDFDEAETTLDRARELGLPEEVYARMKEATDEARPMLPRLLRIAGTVLAVWVGGLIALLVLGLTLSQITLKAARQPPSTQTGESAGLAKGLRSAYRGVLFLSCLYYYISIPIVLGIVVAAGGGLIYAFFAVGRIPIKLLLIVVIVMGVTVWAGLRSFLVRGRDEAPGDRLELERHPRLRQVLDEVAAQIDTRPVDNVYMTPRTDLAVTERGGLLKQLQGTSERCLILGAAVLDGMKIGPFKAILAHEYGHFSNRDTAGGGFALAVRRSLMTMAYSLAAGGAAEWYNPAWLFVNGFNLIFLRISQGASRLQEILADRWAAFAYGARAFEQGLRHVVQRSIAFDTHANSTLQEVVQGKKALSNLYTYKPSKQPTATEIVDATEKALNEKGSPYDSHPPPAERFALVHALGHEDGRETVQAGGEAWTLLEDRENIQRWMTDRIRSVVEVNHGVRIPHET